jgi:predicted dehydrogenase
MDSVNVGVIGCTMSEEFFLASSMSQEKKFLYKKIYQEDDFLKSFAKEKSEQIEFVSDVASIFDDETIELVIISSKKLALAGEALKAGKNVRII